MSVKVKIYNQKGDTVKEKKLNKEQFGLKIMPELIYQVVRYYLARKRNTVAHTKGRSEVRGGGRKPWRQKGTGRARHGSIRSPLWIGGGITFGPEKERNFLQKINKKMKRKALLSSLSCRIKEGNMVLLDKLDIGEGKTKNAVALIENIRKNILKNKKNSSLLFVLGEKYVDFKQAINNLPKVEAIGARNLNVYDILRYDYLISNLEGIELIENIFKLNKK